jgi:hypothetical protein
MPCKVWPFPDWEHFHSILVVYHDPCDEWKRYNLTEVGECFILMLDAVTKLCYTLSELLFTLWWFGMQAHCNVSVHESHWIACGTSHVWKHILICFNQRDSLVTMLFVHCIVKRLTTISISCSFPLWCVVKSWSFVMSASFIIACMEHRRKRTNAVTQVLGGRFQGKSPMTIGEIHQL